MKRRFVLALAVAAALCLGGGCSRDKKDPKIENPKELQFKELPAPQPPGGSGAGQKKGDKSGTPTGQ
jgi:hypothetical protein